MKRALADVVALARDRVERDPARTWSVTDLTRDVLGKKVWMTFVGWNGAEGHTVWVTVLGEFLYGYVCSSGAWALYPIDGDVPARWIYYRPYRAKRFAKVEVRSVYALNGRRVPA